MSNINLGFIELIREVARINISSVYLLYKINELGKLSDINNILTNNDEWENIAKHATKILKEEVYGESFNTKEEEKKIFEWFIDDGRDLLVNIINEINIFIESKNKEINKPKFIMH